jgi:hypothetical protein
MNHPMAKINFEHFHRRPAGRRESDQDGSLPDEVLVPAILSGMEESRRNSRIGVNPCNVWPLVVIAEGTNVTHAKLTAIDPPPISR